MAAQFIQHHHMNCQFELGKIVFNSISAGTGHFGNTLHLAPVVEFHQLNMVTRREIEMRQLTDLATDDIGGIIRTDRAFRARHIGHTQHNIIKFGLFGGKLLLLDLKLFSQSLAFGYNRRTLFGRCGFDGIAEFVFFFGQRLG